MSEAEETDGGRRDGVPVRAWWAAVAVVAATYVYFLIFAEFAFLELARAIAPEPPRMRLLMAGLGVGGIAGAIGAARWYRAERARVGLIVALRVCALAAGLALVARSYWTLFGAGLLVGGSLGALTVVLAASLRQAAGARRLGLCIGLGTGLAYACCNLPWLFQASATVQTAVAVGVALAASLVPRAMNLGVMTESLQVPTADYGLGGSVRWVIILLALVWMDSAAFYVIQHTPALRETTWEGVWVLYGNAAVHLFAAVAAGAVLDRGGRVGIVLGATLALGVACLMLEGVLPAVVPAVWAYTAGVSLYSTVLVEYPARSGRVALAAVVFAVAGWIGSALGIGMAQDLARVPVGFVVVAGTIIAGSFVWRWVNVRSLVGAVVVGATVGAGRAEPAAADAAVARGREVYVAEGCLHCHSQYVRPRVRLDVERWGPASELSAALDAAPPLFGNRRQGPDLANVGNRRNLEWNRLHLLAPREVSPGTRMPSYAYLFADGGERGEALLAYLAALGADTVEARRAQTAAWAPSAGAALAPEAGRRLFVRLCSPCHGEIGRGDGPLAVRLSVRPPDWSRAPWRHVPPEADPEMALGRIIKFGLPGLTMAGHEYLPDREVVGLAQYVRSLQKGSRTAGSTAAPR